MTGWGNMSTLKIVAAGLKVFTELTDMERKNDQEKTVSIKFNKLITNDVQIFVTEHYRHSNRHNRTSVQWLVKMISKTDQKDFHLFVHHHQLYNPLVSYYCAVLPWNGYKLPHTSNRACCRSSEWSYCGSLLLYYICIQ